MLTQDARGVLRNPSKPERPANFGLPPEHDAPLTSWILENLELAIWVRAPEADLDAFETSVLDVLKPPLNLAKVATPSPTAGAARKTMAADVRD